MHRALLDVISEKLCVNLDSVHQSGYSNGAMFNYVSIAELRYSFLPIHKKFFTFLLLILNQINKNLQVQFSLA
jgi:hypothetical protein